MPTQIVQEAEKIVENKFKPILYGRKVVLFEFTPADLDQFVKLHREDKNGYMQQYCLKLMTEEEAKSFVATMFLAKQIKCWSVYIKSNREKRCAGFIYLTHMNSFSADLSGCMDNEIIRGILKYIRKDNCTFAEDAIRTLIKHCFDDIGYNRITASILSNNRRALALNKKSGFKEEGVFKESFHMDDNFYNVVQLAILKKEWKNG